MGRRRGDGKDERRVEDRKNGGNKAWKEEGKKGMR